MKQKGNFTNYQAIKKLMKINNIENKNKKL